jgi:fatty-acyl-CoA synthase
MNLERLRIAGRMLRWLPALAAAGPNSSKTTADLIEKRARKSPTDVFVEFEGRTVSYAEYNAAANRVAHWAVEKGLGRGDVVALLMENRPEYLMVWAGLAKAGVTTALINTQLEGKALGHVIEASECKALVLGSECLPSWEQLKGERPADLPAYVAHGAGVPAGELPPGAKSFDEEISCYSNQNPDRAVRADLTGSDPLFYIYTSGTTGLPKAARFSHSRFMGGGSYHLLSGLNRRDVLYCALPLYHTVGGVICVNAVLQTGARLALRRKFSASRFWADVADCGATSFQYIGEMCRYLINQPESEYDRAHQVRYIVGNGLRPDVWPGFEQRFGIGKIVEFYGATESNVSLVNLEGKQGSIGRLLPGMKAKLVRYDVEKDEHPRDAEGRCIECKPGEPGELLGYIQEGKTAAGRFEGYTSEEATLKKILRNVDEEGDAWFRSGDLLRVDDEGDYYFVDRIGDTFRWKGENVSTQEVAEAVSALPEIELAIVYGVEVPGADGRAGMAALMVAASAELDAEALYRELDGALPGYARPAFVRLQQDVDLTGTFKVRKVDLQKDGFDPATIDEPLFFRDDANRTYAPLTADAHRAIANGEIRF